MDIDVSHNATSQLDCGEHLQQQAGNADAIRAEDLTDAAAWQVAGAQHAVESFDARRQRAHAGSRHPA
jgi:hypothetical protein